MLDADTANQRSQYITGLNSQKEMLKAQQIEDWWANIGNTYFQGIRQRLWDNQEEESNLQFQKAMQAAILNLLSIKKLQYLDLDLNIKQSLIKIILLEHLKLGLLQILL